LNHANRVRFSCIDIQSKSDCGVLRLICELSGQEFERSQFPIGLLVSILNMKNSASCAAHGRGMPIPKQPESRIGSLNREIQIVRCLMIRHRGTPKRIREQVCDQHRQSNRRYHPTCWLDARNVSAAIAPQLSRPMANCSHPQVARLGRRTNNRVVGRYVPSTLADCRNHSRGRFWIRPLTGDDERAGLIRRVLSDIHVYIVRFRGRRWLQVDAWQGITALRSL